MHAVSMRMMGESGGFHYPDAVTELQSGDDAGGLAMSISGDSATLIQAVGHIMYVSTRT